MKQEEKKINTKIKKQARTVTIMVSHFLHECTELICFQGTCLVCVKLHTDETRRTIK